jgi:LysM repeat protein
MKRSPAFAAPPPRLCPLCGSRVANTATRCLVCGTDLYREADRLRRPPSRRGINPIMLGILALLIGVGVLATLMGTGRVPLPEAVMMMFDTATITPTFTPLPTYTATATPSNTPIPTETLRPPIEYVVQEGDSCLLIALIYEVTVESIIMANNLGPECVVAVGHTILVPYPTPTIGPRFTAAPGSTAAVVSAYPTYVVEAGDSCLAIAIRFGVELEDLASANGVGECNFITEGQVLFIPIGGTPTPPATATLAATATMAATTTPLGPAPWPAPNLSAPTNGQVFAAGATVNLQWAAVGTLRAGEYYQVTVEDVTCNCNRRYQTATSQTNLALPPTFAPDENAAHAFSWTVQVVRQAGITGNGQPVYEPAGAISIASTFSWTGQ